MKLNGDYVIKGIAEKPVLSFSMDLLSDSPTFIYPIGKEIRSLIRDLEGSVEFLLVEIRGEANSGFPKMSSMFMMFASRV